MVEPRRKKWGVETRFFLPPKNDAIDYCIVVYRDSPSNIDKVNGVNACGAHASFICPGVCLFVCLSVRT